MKKVPAVVGIVVLCALLVSCAKACGGADKNSEDSTKQGTVSTSSTDESSVVGKVQNNSDENSSSDSVADDSSNDSVTDESSNEEIDQEADQIIYDDNDIKITYKGYTQAGLFQSASFNFLIENNSDKDISVTSENVSVNDYTVSNFLYERIGANKKSNSGVELYDSVLKLNDIETIGKIEFNLKFTDPNTYDTLFTSDKIIITLDENADLGGIPENSQSLYEQDGISVYYVKNTGGTWYSDEGIKFYIQNDTDKNIVVSADNVTVNDFTMDHSLFYASVESHKRTNDTLEIWSSELEDNGITDINKVDFTLRCYDSDTYDDIWETDTITITME
jgi:hypothetical protein